MGYSGGLRLPVSHRRPARVKPRGWRAAAYAAGVDDSLFRPVGEAWNPVSPALATQRRVVLAAPLAALGLLLAGGLAGAVAGGASTLVVAGLGAAVGATLAGAAWTWWWAERNRRSWGWAEADDDLLVTSGVMFRRLVVVPYGRIQLVDVQAGPVERRLGIGRVTLHTASTETAAVVPGVPADVARLLRDRLTALGQARDAGV